MPLSGLYRISGPEVRNTGSFHLEAAPGEHVTLQVATASKGSFASGIVLTSLGGFGLIAGSLVLSVVATSDRVDHAQNVPTPSNDGTWNTAGWVMVAGGAALVVVGVLVLTGNRHSSVEQAPAGQAAAPRPRNDAWLRMPQWRDDRAGIGLPKAIGVPIFETAF